MKKKIHFIINPVAGQPYPILRTLNNICDKYDCPWDISITGPDNVKQLARAAGKSDADIIVVYGGDGTVAEVSGELMASDKIIGVLPGGTANILSLDLGIPQDIKKACELICSGKHTVKKIDVGKVEQNYFLLRLGFGFEAEAVKSANRSFKNQFGWMAYALSGFRALLKTRPTKYNLVLDGHKESCEGLSLIVANSGNIGVPGVSMFPDIDITDGKLDIIVIGKAGLQKLAGLEQKEINKRTVLSLFKHWQAEQVSVSSSPAQAIHYDGEILKKKKVEIGIHHQAMRVIGK